MYNSFTIDCRKLIDDDDDTTYLSVLLAIYAFFWLYFKGIIIMHRVCCMRR